MLKSTSESRKQQLEELRNFTDEVNKEITNIIGALGWTRENTMANIDKEYFTCPYDPSHQLTEGSLSDHLISCQWKTEGYGKLDVPLSEPTLPTDSPYSIKFDEKLQYEVLKKAKEQNPAIQIGIGERLIPRTSDRLLTDFTSDERKALYDYVISNTAKPDIGQDIADIGNLKQEKQDKELSFLELLVQERNLKRRRAKHRGVHTNKKSHVEILRELINQQMEIYTDYMLEQNNSDHVQTIESNDSNHEATQNETGYLYKVFHTSSRNYDDLYSRERNDNYNSKRDELKKEHLEEKDYRRPRDQSRQERYSDESYRKHRRSEHRKSSHSRDRKSSHSRDRKLHKKSKHRSKDSHKDRHHEKKHKSRDKSSERHSKHSDHKRKKKNKD